MKGVRLEAGVDNLTDRNDQWGAGSTAGGRQVAHRGRGGVVRVSMAQLLTRIPDWADSLPGI